MADFSWIDPLAKNMKGFLGLDPKAAGEGRLMQQHGDLYAAQTETEKYRLNSLLPAQVGVADADKGHKVALTKKVGSETAGIDLKNKGAQGMADFLADEKNYVTTPDGRRVPDPAKLSALFSSASLSAGDKSIQHLPGFVGGINLQGNAGSPLANLAAGGTNAIAGKDMLKPVQLNPDQTMIQKDPLTGRPITGLPAAPRVPVQGIGVLTREEYDKREKKSIADSLAPTNLPYTAPASATKLQVAAGHDETILAKAEKDNEARITAAISRGETAEEVARIRNEGAAEVARIRGKGKGSSSSSAATGGNGEGVAPIDLNRLADREKAATEWLVNAFGKSGHNIDANHAALIASAATQSFPNDPAGTAIQKFMTQNGISTNSAGWNRVDFKQGGKDMDFEALRTKLFGAQPGAAASATGAPGTPIVGGAAPAAGGPVAGVVAGGAPAAPAAGGKKDSFEVEGIPFTKGSNLATERKHGDKYTGVNATTGQLETRYWDAENKGWTDSPIGGREEDLESINELNDTRRGTRDWTRPNGPDASEKGEAEDELLKKAVAEGALSPEEYDAVTKFGKVSGSKSSTAERVVGKLREIEAGKAKRDPRIVSYAKGDFLDDKGIPDDALKLAERLGIDREAYGLPKKVNYSGKGTNIAGNIWDDLRGSAVGPLINPVGYSEERDAIEKGLKAFFADIQAGKVRTTPKPRNEVPAVAGPAGSKAAEAAPKLPAETKISPPEVNKGVPTQTKETSHPKKEAKKPLSVADVVAPKSKSSGMTPDEIKIMLAEQHRQEIIRRNGMGPQGPK